MGDSSGDDAVAGQPVGGWFEISVCHLSVFDGVHFSQQLVVPDHVLSLLAL